ncbi:MAG: hypothetical protein SNJ73_00820, partial [Acetobacteraceae bacterium]
MRMPSRDGDESGDAFGQARFLGMFRRQLLADPAQAGSVREERRHPDVVAARHRHRMTGSPSGGMATPSLPMTRWQGLQSAAG